MTPQQRYGVVIAGGGLAGLCLAIQLKGRSPELSILVVERNEHPLPEAAHKVGESSVEMASHYFCKVLGLSDVLARETPKFGLRFFMSHGDNRDITARLECGPSHFLHVPSFQIDRGRFENELARRARALGVEFIDGCQLGAVELASGGEDHAVRLDFGSREFDLRCRWFVDASGRPGILKQKLALGRPNRHDVNAAWFRMDVAIDPDDWADGPDWTDRPDWADRPKWGMRLKESRRLSTNHLMGEGYWVWLIPLVNDRTSVGIVADARLHPFSEFNTFEKSLQWLDAHEPQCAAILRANADQRMDFLALRDYSYDVKQVYSRDRWGLVGDAGAFIDPLYSPGGDFIGLANGFLSDLIVRDYEGERIDEAAAVYDRAFRSLTRTFLMTYHRQYALMGNPRIMSTKVVWDFAMYWGGVALIFCRGRFCNVDFMNRIRPLLQSFAYTNIAMQAFFREWAECTAGADPPACGAFVDYAEIPFLAQMNHSLLRESDDDSLFSELSRNLELAKQLKLEIIAEASRFQPSLARGVDAPSTTHLEHIFAAMRPRS